MKGKKIVVFILAALMVLAILPVSAMAEAGFSVTYDGNGATGGTVPVDSNVYNSGDTITVPGNTGDLALADHVFTGWNTAADGSGTVYAAGSTFAIGANAILYAQWAPAVCTVKFDVQGGSAVADWTGNYGTAVPTAPVTTKAGYDFCGWYTDSTFATQVVFPYTVTKNATFYAKWEGQNAYLASVGISAGTLSRPFSKKCYSYKIALPENVGSVTITPVAENSKAMLIINRSARPGITVNVANNKTKVVSVKVKYGSQAHVYTFVIKRAKSADNNLASLSVSGGMLSPAFDPSVTNYTLNLDQSTGSVTIRAKAASSSAKVTSARKTYKLKNGATMVVKITVKAQSGKKKTYTIKIVRAGTPSTGKHNKKK